MRSAGGVVGDERVESLERRPLGCCWALVELAWAVKLSWSEIEANGMYGSPVEFVGVWHHNVKSHETIWFRLSGDRNLNVGLIWSFGHLGCVTLFSLELRHQLLTHGRLAVLCGA